MGKNLSSLKVERTFEVDGIDELIWAAAENIFYGNDIKEITKECNRWIDKYAG